MRDGFVQPNEPWICHTVQCVPREIALICPTFNEPEHNDPLEILAHSDIASAIIYLRVSLAKGPKSKQLTVRSSLPTYLPTTTTLIQPKVCGHTIIDFKVLCWRNSFPEPNPTWDGSCVFNPCLITTGYTVSAEPTWENILYCT